MTIKAIVTGHSRGLGAAIAEDLLQRGVAVLGLARRHNDELAARFPAGLAQHAIDLADPARLAAWLGGGEFAGFAADGDMLLLVNDAGTLQPVGPPRLQDVAAIAPAVALNVAAPLMLAAAVAAVESTAAERRVLHVSSGAARKPYAGWSVYCATKAALDHHARAVQADAQAGLRICSAAPGVVDTGMQAEVRASTLEQFPLRDQFAAMQRAGGLIPPAAAAARLVAHLLSEDFGAAPVVDLRDLPG
ncbi:SDR family oxidoreductase [Thauera sinica]|uniref:SDR family oxidoreductase n=1 Tax=Thauera sinica TaxID=2665146 RepID=A0ABW1AVZ2_9RHOO|nr:SDR family oxidoreductase [Thauera sp. K11]ATE61149.1 short-chain dehydrogenase [Thauera sp. K11]